MLFVAFKRADTATEKDRSNLSASPEATSKPRRTFIDTATAPDEINQRFVQVLASEDLAALAKKLPEGRLYGNGRGFVPNVRQSLYSEIISTPRPSLLVTVSFAASLKGRSKRPE